MRPALRLQVVGVWAALVSSLCGCGGTSHTATVTATRTVEQTTTTATAVRAAVRFPTPLPRLSDPASCGNGITSNADCNGTSAIVAEFRQRWQEAGVPPASYTARDGTPIACTGYAHNAWLCKSVGTNVYFAFSNAGPNRPSAPPPTVTAATNTATSTSAPQSVGPPTPSGVTSFSGNGAENIGTVKAASTSTIHWANDGSLFQVLDLGINSQGHSGTSALPAGTYPNLEVNADGNWTMRIVSNG